MTKAKNAANLQVDYEELRKASIVLRAINHKIRQDILNLIHRNEEMTGTAIYNHLKIEQSRTSAFLAILRKAGVVNTRKEEQSVYYFVNYERLSKMEKGAKIINGRS
jgi:predicted transcriptional regulator